MKTFLKIFIFLVLAVGLFTFAFYRTPAERAFTQFAAAAQTGDADAMLELARAYRFGTGTKPNTQQAVSWYQQAAVHGKTQASFELYQLYSQGKEIPADEQAANTYLLAAARAGHTEAQLTLGNLYELGQGVAQHEGQALFWYLQALPNATAQAKVTALQNQQPQLYQAVIQFMQKMQAATQQDAQAQLEIAQAYRQGTPVAKDPELAHTWLQKAWENGHSSQAAFELYEQYTQGEGVAPQANAAAMWLARAAELKNPSAQYVLGEQAYTDNPPRYEDGFAWFSNAAAQGHAPAQYMTGFMLLQGLGTQKSVPLAIRFFEQAAQQNNDSAQYVLGQIYTKGLGVKKDVATGRKWLERAAENGNPSATALLGN